VFFMDILAFMPGYWFVLQLLKAACRRKAVVSLLGLHVGGFAAGLLPPDLPQSGSLAEHRRVARFGEHPVPSFAACFPRPRASPGWKA
jgi:hypothetical protein